MTSAGLLTVHASLTDGRLENIAVHLTRPPVTRVFFGQIPDAVVKAIPYLYTLCAHAQRAVAQAAVAAALGEARRPVDDTELWIEMLHENFWRLLLDWPMALGLPPAQEAFATWRGARQRENCLTETQKLLVTVRSLAEKCLAIMADRARAAGDKASAEAGSGPEERPAHGAHKTSEPVRFATEQWLAYWQGALDYPPGLPHHASVEAAYRTRLAEVDWAATALATKAAYPIAAAGQDGWGVGQTLTARGILTHAAHVVDGRILNYRVSAPTDVFFADPAGLTALLAGQQFASPEAAKQGLEQAILALDPCLPYALELKHA